MSDKLGFNKVKAVIFDVDGVFTDGRTWQDAQGIWRRHFSVRDTMAIRALRKADVLVIVLTSASSPEIRQHMTFVGVDQYQDNCSDKDAAIDALSKQYGFSRAETSFVTAQHLDLELLKSVGYGITVPFANEDLKEAAALVTTQPGGEGAVAEACFHILKALKVSGENPNVIGRARKHRRSASF